MEKFEQLRYNISVFELIYYLGGNMITKELIEEINTLSRKQRTVGLTPEEKERQTELRQAYLVSFRENMKSVLDNIEIVDELPKNMQH